MTLPAPRAPGPIFARFQHENLATKLRLQSFLAIRDASRRVALVRLEDQPDLWRLPGESTLLNESPQEAADRVAKMWFASTLLPKLADVQSYPATDAEDDDRWYLIFVHECAAPSNLQGTPDTLEVRFVEPGKAPGPMYGDHESVLARLAK